jgi:hypothetical protein
MVVLEVRPDELGTVWLARGAWATTIPQHHALESFEPDALPHNPHSFAPHSPPNRFLSHALPMRRLPVSLRIVPPPSCPLTVASASKQLFTRPAVLDSTRASFTVFLSHCSRLVSVPHASRQLHVSISTAITSKDNAHVQAVIKFVCITQPMRSDVRRILFDGHDASWPYVSRRRAQAHAHGQRRRRRRTHPTLYVAIVSAP